MPIITTSYPSLHTTTPSISVALSLGSATHVPAPGNLSNQANAKSWRVMEGQWRVMEGLSKVGVGLKKARNPSLTPFLAPGSVGFLSRIAKSLDSYCSLILFHPFNSVLQTHSAQGVYH